jgi:F-type H+-transporting ATPase subunit delta
MSSALTLARPYARAAFEMARGANALADWTQKLSFAAEVANDSGVRNLVGNPKLAATDLVGLFLAPSESANAPFANFIGLLAENHRLILLPEIAALYTEMRHEAQRILTVSVRSATALGDSQVIALKAALKKRFGRDIELEQQLDPSLLGGAVIDAGDVVIDGSVTGRLHRLESALAH